VPEAACELGLGRGQTSLALLDVPLPGGEVSLILCTCGRRPAERVEVLDLDLDDGREEAVGRHTGGGGAQRPPPAPAALAAPRRLGPGGQGTLGVSHVRTACTWDDDGPPPPRASPTLAISCPIPRFRDADRAVGADTESAFPRCDTRKAASYVQGSRPDQVQELPSGASRAAAPPRRLEVGDEDVSLVRATRPSGPLVHSGLEGHRAT